MGCGASKKTPVRTPERQGSERTLHANGAGAAPAVNFGVEDPAANKPLTVARTSSAAAAGGANGVGAGVHGGGGGSGRITGSAVVLDDDKEKQGRQAMSEASSHLAEQRAALERERSQLEAERVATETQRLNTELDRLKRAREDAEKERYSAEREQAEIKAQRLRDEAQAEAERIRREAESHARQIKQEAEMAAEVARRKREEEERNALAELQRRRLEEQADIERQRLAAAAEAERLERLAAERKRADEERLAREAEERERERLRLLEEDRVVQARRRQLEEEEREKRDLSLKLMRMKESEERRLMEEEERRSIMREEKEAEQRKILEYQYELMRREAEEARLRELQEAARRQDEENLANPDMVSFSVIFTGDVVQQRYRFHLPKDAVTVMDLKMSVAADFGYAPNQQRMYFKFRELQDSDLLTDLPSWGEHSYILLFPLGMPYQPPERVLRPLQKEITVASVKMWNSRQHAQQEESLGGEPVPHADELPYYRNWADEALLIAQRPRDSVQERLDADKAYLELFGDFLKLAEKGAQMIVEGQVRKAPPMLAYGSGGDKYVIGGLMFRKAWNWEVLNQNVGEGDSAFKVAGHELKSLQFLRGKVEHLMAPLSATVDIYGIRFLVQSVAPIEFDTLVYGSNTDGLVFENTDPLGAQCARSVATLCNLKEHAMLERLTGRTIDPLYTPSTVEFHKRDDDYVCYPLSCGRLFPPDLGPKENSTEPIDWLTSLLRPELVVNFGKNLPREGEAEQPSRIPLNPDAPLAAAAGLDVAVDMNNLRAASLYLRDVVVPQLAADLNSGDLEVYTSKDLTSEMHERGINMRYLGRLANLLMYNHVRELCVREIVARVIKTLVRDDLSYLASCSADAAKGIVVTYFNSALGNDRGENARRVWTFIRDLAMKKFSFELEDSVKDKLYLHGLMLSVGEKIGVEFNADIAPDFQSPTPYSIDDIVSIQSTVKPGTQVASETVEGLLAAAREMDSAGKRSVWHFDGGPERLRATDMYREAVHAAEHVYGFSDLRVADAYWQFAEHLESRHCEAGRPERSRWNKAAFVAEDELSSLSRAYYAKALQIRELNPQTARTVETARMYMALARLQKPTTSSHPLSPSATAPPVTNQMVVRSKFSREANDISLQGDRDADGNINQEENKTKMYMVHAAELVKELCGYQHPETAEVFAQVALMYSELNDIPSACEWIRHSFVITAKIFGLEHDLTKEVHKLLQSIESRNDDHLDRVPIEQLAERIEYLTLGPTDDEDYD